MSCDCTGTEITTALADDNLLKVIQAFPNVSVIDTLLFLVSNPALGVNGSGHITAFDLKNFILEEIRNQTLFFPIDANVDYQGSYRVRTISGSGSASFTFSIPSDFLSLVSITATASPTSVGGAGPGKDVDLESKYGLIGESVSAHNELDSIIVDSGVVDTFFQFDISSVFTALSAGDICGIEIKHNGVGGSWAYFDIALTYVRNI